MKHYKIFGSSLPNGIQKIGYSDVMVQIVGILIHALSISPYAGAIKEIVSNLEAMGVNGTNEFPFPDLNNDQNMTTSLCTFQNDSSSSPLNYFCIGELSLGTAGILIHLMELLLVFIVLKVGKERNVDKCKLWVKLTTALTLLDIGILLIGSLVLKPDEKVMSYTITNIIYKLYSCGLISAYTTSAESQEESTNSPENSESAGTSNLIQNSETG